MQTQKNRFVFFDCECSNCKDGIGKICSLGYVITDFDFNILQSQDIVMNPESEFDWYLFSKKAKCSLAYPKEYFISQPNFAFFYPQLKTLFSPESVVLGFAVANDVGFVNSACNRYKKEFIEFHAFDLEKLFSSFYEEKRKLKEWSAFFTSDNQNADENCEKIVAHNSKDDALMTMLCFKEFCKKNSVSPLKILEQYKDFYTSTRTVYENEVTRQKRKKIKEKIKKYYEKQNHENKKDAAQGLHFELDSSLLKDLGWLEKTHKLVKKIYDNGGVCHRYIQNSCGYVVFADGAAVNWEKLQKRNLQGIYFSELNKELE